MSEPNFGWEYPPGVSGLEPEITGDWPEDDKDPDSREPYWDEEEDDE